MTGAEGEAADLVVVGAGPAGIGAATAAAAQGLRIVLLDEADWACQGAAGALHHAAVAVRLGETVWSVAGAYRVDTIGAAGPRHYQAPAVIVATGLQERIIPFPGWTHPSVFGLAAMMSRLRAPSELPGRRVLVAGVGPMLASVTVSILEGGGQVLAIADLAARREWLRIIGGPALLRSADVKTLHRTTVTEIVSDPTGLRVALGSVDHAGRAVPGANLQHVVVDEVVVFHGFSPANEITRLLRVDHTFDPAQGVWRPVLDGDGRSRRPGLYVAGGAAGMEAAAHMRGQLAGLAAARDMGRLSASAHERAAAPLRRKVERSDRLRHAMVAMMAPRAGLIDAIPADTVVCPCEHVTRAEIDAAVDEGAVTLNQVKAWTRCGMGACQGRICADIAGALLAAHGIPRSQAGQFTGRTPLRPVPLDLLTGSYGYADIQLPPAAPL
jgi:pyruvate/2-oxoglutarate dehydrogenase complex dihydrolipoamide dehydrogenase (E3) component/bacterioferritin-associated ferredoxin